MSTDVVVSVDGVSKKFSRGLRNALMHGAADIRRELTWWRDFPAELRPGEFWALRDVSFELRRGDSLAVIGANGAGKSTLLKLISGLLKPDTGRISINGKLRAMIELGAAFNPVLSGRENIFAQGALYGYARKSLTRQLDSIVDFAGLADSIDTPVQQYSDGMRARLGFAVAVNLEPDILLVDEVLAVGDIGFQNKCLRYIRDYIDRGGSLVFVGHGSHQVQSACRSGMVLTSGVVSFSGNVVEALDYYLKQQSALTGESKASGSEAVAAPDKGVRISGVEARPTGRAMSISTGQPLEITARCVSRSEIERVSLGFVFFAPDGKTSVGGGLVSPPVTLAAGSNCLTVVIPSLPLMPGSYLLRLHLLDWSINYAIALYGWEGSPHAITVELAPHEFANGSALAGLRVFMQSEWKDDA